MPTPKKIIYPFGSDTQITLENRPHDKVCLKINDKDFGLQSYVNATNEQAAAFARGILEWYDTSYLDERDAAFKAAQESPKEEKLKVTQADTTVYCGPTTASVHADPRRILQISAEYAAIAEYLQNGGVQLEKISKQLLDKSFVDLHDDEEKFVRETYKKIEELKS